MIGLRFSPLNGCGKHINYLLPLELYQKQGIFVLNRNLMENKSMKRALLLLAILAVYGQSSICKENLFLADVYYGTKAELTLDSANWDIKDGGDRNYYSYDAHGYITRNVRVTSTTNDTILFVKESDDTLIWYSPENSTRNWIRYHEYGYNTEYNNGYGTDFSVERSQLGDTLISKILKKYHQDSPEYEVYKLFKVHDSIRQMRIVGIIDPDTTILNCIESSIECNCSINSVDVVKYVRTINEDVISDTLWANGIATQSRHYHKSNHSESPSRIEGKRIVLKHKSKFERYQYDLIGRMR